MKKNILLLLLCIILIFIGILIYFTISSNETLNKSAEEYFNISNKDTGVTVNNLNMFSDSKISENENFGQITRKLKEGTITSSGTTIIITNRTNVKFYYTIWYSIEKKVNNNWTLVTPKDTNSIDVGSNYIMPNKSVEIKLDWSQSYGKLEKRRI